MSSGFWQGKRVLGAKVSGGFAPSPPTEPKRDGPHENIYLKLDTSKVRALLDWSSTGTGPIATAPTCRRERLRATPEQSDLRELVKGL